MSDPNAGKWEMPGGKLDPGEGVLEAARREFEEETGIPVPGELAGTWTSPDGVYQGFVYVVDREADVSINPPAEKRVAVNPDDPDGDFTEVVAWWAIDDARDNPVVRQEVVQNTPWDKLADVARARQAAIGPAEMLPVIRDVSGRGAPKKRQRLQRASKRLARVDQRLRSKLHAGAEVAVADGLRRAGVKVTQRAAKRSKTAQAVVAGCGGAYTPTVLAAAGITEQEALDHALDGFAVSAAAWMATARRDRIRILVDELDITDEDAAALDDEYAGAESRSIDFLVAGLAALALARLANPAVPDTGRGETIDGHVPAGLVYDALAIADGRAAAGPGNDGVGTLDAGEWDVDRFGGGITLGAINDAAGGDVVEQLTWIWGGSGRPFDPHLELDGSTTTADAMETDWANTEGWPDAPFYFPGDHYGCNCEWVSEFVTGDDGEGDATGDGE